MSDFETPSPQKSSGHDFTLNPLRSLFPIDYKAGKLEALSTKMFFDGKVDPADLKQGFVFYDSELKSQVYLPTPFTAYVIGLYFAAYSDSDTKSTNKNRYSSNLVNDTRTDIMSFSYFENGSRKTEAFGLYADHIKPAVERLGRKSAYTKVLVVYIPELRQIRQINLNATSEAGIIKAMAKSYGTPEWKTKLYGLTPEMENEMWVFRFKGEFEPVVFAPKEQKNVPATLPADRNSPATYFQPVLEAGVIRPTNEKFAAAYAAVDQMRKDFTEYINSELAYYKAAYMEKVGPIPTDKQYADAQAAAAPTTAAPTAAEEVYFAQKHQTQQAPQNTAPAAAAAQFAADPFTPINTSLKANQNAVNAGFEDTGFPAKWTENEDLDIPF